MIPLNANSGVPPAFTGQRASYVALAAITTLSLALLTSIWTSDVSGSIAVLGLLSVYLASSELLLLYAVFGPASVIVDIVRLSVHFHYSRGKGWLIFFTILEMAAKVAGGVLAWSLHKSAAQGEVPYRPLSQGGSGQGGSQGGPQHMGDPFAAYQPPPAQPDALHPIQSTYQPFPTSQPASLQHA